MTPDEFRDRLSRLSPNGYYTLDGHRPVPCHDLMTWGEWYTNHTDARIVAKTSVGVLEVSTVFLGLDHNFSGQLDPDADRTPILFETMIFGIDEDDGYQERCATWEEAEQQHQIAVAVATARHLGTKDELAKILTTAMDRATDDKDIGFGSPDPQP